MAVFGRMDPHTKKPPDAIELRQEQVAGFYKVVMETWEPKSEVWALSHGPMILGVGGALSGMYGNMYFRRKLRLRNFGFFSTYMPNMALPFLIVSTFHTMVEFYHTFSSTL